MRGHLIILILILGQGQLRAQWTRIQADSLQTKLEETTDVKSQVKILNALVQYYEFHYQDSAILYANQGLALLKDTDENTNKIFLLVAMGRIYVKQGAYDKAITNLLIALRLAEASNSIDYLIIIRVNMGAAYDRQNQFDQALKEYQEALELINKHLANDTTMKPHYYKANVFNNMANVFLSKQDTVKMIEYYEQALAENEKTEDPQTRGVILNNLGKTYIEHREYETGKRYILESLELKEVQNDFIGIAQCYRNLGLYFVEKNIYDSAIYFYQKGVTVAVENGGQREEMEMYEGLARCYKKMGNHEKALQNFEKFKQLSDSLYNDNKAVEITKLKNTYEFEKEQAKVLLEQKSKELKLYIFIGLLIAGIALAFFVAFFLWSRMKRSRLKQRSLELEKTNLNLKLEHKSKELTTTVLYLYKKNELIGQILRELGDIRARLKPENLSFFDRIVRGLDKLTEENTWTEFETRFNEVHQNFYKILQTRYPELTPNERRLCAFLKLSMTSKEISSITGQSIRGIDVARTRLRKKFDLTNSDVNLVDFLSGIEPPE